MRNKKHKRSRKRWVGIVLAVLMIAGVLSAPIVSAIDQARQQVDAIPSEAELVQQAEQPDPEGQESPTEADDTVDESQEPGDTIDPDVSGSTDQPAEGGVAQSDQQPPATDPEEELMNEDEGDESTEDAAGKVYLDAYLVNREGKPIRVFDTPDEHERYVREVSFEEDRVILEDDRLNEGRSNYAPGEMVWLKPDDIRQINNVDYQYLDKKDGAEDAADTEHPFEFPADTDVVRKDLAYMRRVNVRFFVTYPGKEVPELLLEIPDHAAVYTGDILDMSNYPVDQLTSELPEDADIKGWTTDISDENAIRVAVDGQLELRDQDLDFYLDYDYDYATVTYKYFLSGYRNSYNQYYYDLFPIDIHGNELDKNNPDSWIYLNEGNEKKHEINGSTELLPGQEITLNQFEEKIQINMGGMERNAKPILVFRGHSGKDAPELVPEGGYARDDKVTLKSGDHLTVYVPYATEYEYNVLANYPEGTDETVTSQGEVLATEMICAYDESSQIWLNRIMKELRGRKHPGQYGIAGIYAGKALGVQSAEEIQKLNDDNRFINFNNYVQNIGRWALWDRILKDDFFKENNFYIVWTEEYVSRENYPKYSTYYVNKDGQAIDKKGEIIDPEPHAPISLDDVEVLGERTFGMSNMQSGMTGANEKFIIPGLEYSFSVYSYATYFKHPETGESVPFEINYSSYTYHGNRNGFKAVLDVDGNLYLVDNDTGEVSDQPMTQSETLYGFRGPLIMHFHRGLHAEDDAVYSRALADRNDYISPSLPFNRSPLFSEEALNGKVFSHWTRSPIPSPADASNEDLPAEQKRYYGKPQYGSGSTEIDNDKYLRLLNGQQNEWMYPLDKTADDAHFYAWYTDAFGYFQVENLLVNNEGTPIDKDTGAPLVAGADFEANKFVINSDVSKPIEMPAGRLTEVMSETYINSSVHKETIEDAQGNVYVPSLSYLKEGPWEPFYKIPWLRADGSPAATEIATRNSKDNPETLYLGYSRNMAIKAYPNYPGAVKGAPEDVSIAVGSPYKETLSKDGKSLTTTLRKLEVPAGYRLAGWSTDEHDKESIVLGAGEGAYVPNLGDGISLYAQWVKEGDDAYTGKVSMHSHLVSIDGVPLDENAQPGPDTVAEAKQLRGPENITIDIPEPGSEDLNVNYFSYYPRARNFTSQDGTLRYRYEPKSTQYGGHENIKAVLLTPENQTKDVYFGYAGMQAHELKYEMNIPEDITMQDVASHFQVDNNMFYAGERVTPELAIFADAVNNQANYRFDGWTENEDGTGTVYSRNGANEYVMPEGGATLYAKWTKMPDRFINYIARDNGKLGLDGEEFTSKQVYYPHNTLVEDMTLPTNLPDDGYTFSHYHTPTSWGWKGEDIGSDGLPKPGTRITTDQQIQVHFKKIPSVQVTFQIDYPDQHMGYFDMNGSKAYSSVQTVQQGTAFDQLTVPKAVAEDTYVFTGWTPQLPGDADKVMQNITYRATFALKPQIVLQANNARKWEYDGEELTEPGYTQRGTLKEGDFLSEKPIVEGSITDAGEAPNVITNADSIRVHRMEGLQEVDVTDEYILKFEQGKLTVHQRYIRFYVNDAQKYEGEDDPEHFDFFYWGSLVNEDDLGEITVKRDAGETVGTYDLYLHTSKQNDNYELEVEKGVFSILKVGEYRLTHHVTMGDRVPDHLKPQLIQEVEEALDRNLIQHIDAGEDATNRLARLEWYPDNLPYNLVGWAEQENETDPSKIYHQYDTNNPFIMPARDVDIYSQWEDYGLVVVFDAGEHGQLTDESLELQLLDSVPSDFSDVEDPGITPDTGWAFTGWSPELPSSGEITEDQYFVAQYEPTLPIEKPIITITAGSDTKEYDGTALSLQADNLYTANFTEKLDETDELVQVEVEHGSQTEVGAKPTQIKSGYQVLRGGVQDVTDKYTIYTAEGELKVTPRELAIEVEAGQSKIEGQADPQFKGELVYAADSSKQALMDEAHLQELDIFRIAADANKQQAGDDITLTGRATFTNLNYDVVEVREQKFTIHPKPAPNRYTLTYHANVPSDASSHSGAVHAALSHTSSTHEAAEVVTNLASFGALPGEYPYTFGGWAQNADGSQPVGTSFTMPAKNTTLYATWNRTEEYQVTVKAGTGGGLNGSKQDVIIKMGAGEKWADSKLPTPTPEDGYYFDKWEGKPDAGEVINSDRTITAVFAKKSALTIATDSAQKVYDGTPLRANHYTTTGQLKSGDQLVVQVTGAVQNVSSVQPGNNTFTYKVLRGGAQDVTHQYMVTEKPGTLTIEPIAVTLQVQDVQKTQGTADPAFGYVSSVSPILGSGFVVHSPVRAAQDASKESPGLVTLVPNYENTHQNYRVTGVNGTLEIIASGGGTDPTPPVTPPTTPPPTNPPVTPPTTPPATTPPTTTPPVTPTPPVTTPPTTPTPTPDRPGSGGTIDPSDPSDPGSPGGTGDDAPGIAPVEEGGADAGLGDQPARTAIGQAYQDFFDSPAPTLQIGDAEVPLYGRSDQVWALLNLILAIVGVIVAVVLFVTYFLRSKQEEDEQGELAMTNGARRGQEDVRRYTEDGEEPRQKKNLVWRILAGVVAVLAVIVFIVTQDMTRTMSLFDEWTLLMAVLLGVEIVFTVLSRFKKQPKDEDGIESDDKEELQAVEHRA